MPDRRLQLFSIVSLIVAAIITLAALEATQASFLSNAQTNLTLTLQSGDDGTVICSGGRRLRVVSWEQSRHILNVECLPGGTTSTPTPAPIVTPTPTATPALTPTPTPEPGTGSGSTATFPEVGSLTLGTCSAEVHDKYFVTGPDGNKYRTWHPVKDSSGCTFAHEHGDKPNTNGPLPPFGYVSHVAGADGEIAAHSGFKVFSHYANGQTGMGGPELDYAGLPIDFTVALHQGTGGAGRITIQDHSFWFWSRDQEGRVTQVTQMADTGSSCRKDGPDVSGCGRVLVTHSDYTYEIWEFGVNVGGAFVARPNAAITNPMTHLHDPVLNSDGSIQSATLTSTSTEICGPNFVPCDPKLPFGDPGSLWLGNFRTMHEPDWVWTNQGGSESFCTTPNGTRTTCGAGTITQKVPAVSLSNASARILDRTPNSTGWDNTYNLPVGAPGGN